MIKDMVNLFFGGRPKMAGINARNVKLVNPNNKRKDFLFANDKLETKIYLEANNIAHPETYATVETMGEIDDKWKIISQYDRFALKPAKGRTGDGILVLEKKGDDLWHTPSGKPYNGKKIKKHLVNVIFGLYSLGGNSDRAIIEYYLTAHEFFGQIYPGGVPDFRVILLDSVPLMGMLRMPTNQSDGKGNLHQGALGIGVDMEKGELKKGFNGHQFYSEHPDSGKKFEGMKIPYWDKIIDISIASAKHCPLKYLGVDIVIDQDLGPMIIEVNARPGLAIQNANQKGLFELLEEKGMCPHI